MKDLRCLQSFLILFLVGFASYTLQACGDDEDDEPVQESDKEEVVKPGEAIDLGLPSGTLWANCNIGATSPEDFGGYYAWGETKEKIDYSLTTYKWCNGSYNSMTKYCVDSLGFVDNKIVLEPGDDVAHAKWGGNWYMPTLDEIKELMSKCTWEWTQYNGVFGQLLTGTNGNQIFLPAAGFRSDTGLYSNQSGYYWSIILSDKYSCNACCLSIEEDDCKLDYYAGRCNGFSVRPVCRRSDYSK